MKGMICARCGDDRYDDALMGFDDFEGGVVFHAVCLANALHAALVADDALAARLAAV